MNSTPFTPSGIAPLPSLGVIRAHGPDAAAFLHGQFTQDFLMLDLSHARLAAFCTPKGRMQASFIGFKRSNDEILLICSSDVLPTTLKRLSMFVLRAKVQLTDASAQYAVHGLVGNAIEQIAVGPYSTWDKSDLGAANLIFLPPAEGLKRALWCAPIEQAAPSAPPLDFTVWQWLEVRSGVAMVTAPLVEAFVPQMLNYESVGGVNFKKGCYPGQEVVARSQFRGTLKRRTYLAHVAASDEAPFVGQEVFQEGDAEQPCGLVAACAAAPSGGVDVLMAIQVAATTQALSLGNPGGPRLSLLSLPYALLEDV